MTVVAGCSDEAILVTGVNFYKNEVFVGVNESIKLDYKVFPSNCTNAKVTFWSTDDNIASVDAEGNVTLKTEGEASIVVRTVDGGFEDSCKIISYVDPTSIAFKSDSEYPVNVAPAGSEYNFYTSLAVEKTAKLKVDFFLNGVASDDITNKNVVFSSSNTSNVVVLDENQGVIKAVSGVAEGVAYSDITATVSTKDGNIKSVCRVFVNKASNIDNLFVHYANGEELLANRDGSDVLELTAEGSSSEATEFYAYILNTSGEKKTDVEFMFSTNDQEQGVVELSVDKSLSDQGIYKFSLKPVEEGSAILYLNTTCLDGEGKAISLSISINVRAAVNSVTISASDRKDGSYEILTNGELFSFVPQYKDASGRIIEGATRELHFDEFAGDLANYVRSFGNNNFRVIAVPENMNQLFTISGFVYKYPNGEQGKVYFSYSFYIRNTLEGLVVSLNPKTTEEIGGKDVTTLPQDGISALTLTQRSGTWESVDVYAYATSFNSTDTEPVSVSLVAYDSTKIFVAQDGANKNKFTLTGVGDGQTTLTFVATNGVEEITYSITIYTVTVN